MKLRIRFHGYSRPWELLPLHNCGLTFPSLSGKTKEDFGHGDARYVTYMNVFTNPIAKLDGVDSIEIDNTQTEVKKGDIFFTISSETPEEVGMSSVWLGEEKNVYLNSFCFGYRPFIKIDPFFIAHFLRSDFFRQQIIFLAQGISRFNISKTKVMELLLALPTDVEEQEKIGQYFVILDRLLSNKVKELEKTECIKKACMHRMFPQLGESAPQLRFKGFTTQWESYKLGDIGKTFSSLSGKTKEDFGHGEARFVTYMNVFTNPIADLDGTEPIEIDDSQSQVQYGDIFFTTSSETPEEVGMSSVWMGDKKNVYLNSFCFGYRLKKDINPLFIAYFLRSPLFRERITFLAQGISRFNISKNKAMEIDVLIPPSLKEQEKIGNYFQNMDRLIASKRQELEKLQNIKQALLGKMFVNQ